MKRIVIVIALVIGVVGIVIGSSWTIKVNKAFDGAAALIINQQKQIADLQKQVDYTSKQTCRNETMIIDILCYDKWPVLKGIWSVSKEMSYLDDVDKRALEQWTIYKRDKYWIDE